MRKHRSKTVDQIQEIASLARQLHEARIDASLVEWLRTLALDPDLVDIARLKADIAEARRGGFPRIVPSAKKTVEDVPNAKGSFRW